MIVAFKIRVVPKISECVQKIQAEHGEYWVDFQRALKHQFMNEIWEQELDLQPRDFKSHTRMVEEIEGRIVGVVDQFRKFCNVDKDLQLINTFTK